MIGVEELTAIDERWQKRICKSGFASAVLPSKDIDRRSRRFIHELALNGRKVFSAKSRLMQTAAWKS